jgi:hypothetical protein
MTANRPAPTVEPRPQSLKRTDAAPPAGQHCARKTRSVCKPEPDPCLPVAWQIPAATRCPDRWINNCLARYLWLSRQQRRVSGFCSEPRRATSYCRNIRNTRALYEPSGAFTLATLSCFLSFNTRISHLPSHRLSIDVADRGVPMWLDGPWPVHRPALAPCQS